jgi:hypothetical protein
MTDAPTRTMAYRMDTTTQQHLAEWCGPNGWETFLVIREFIERQQPEDAAVWLGRDWPTIWRAAMDTTLPRARG